MRGMIFLLVAFSIFFKFNAIASEQSYIDKPSTKWGNAILVTWDNPTSNNLVYRKIVEKAIEESWSKHSRIKFYGWGPSDSYSSEAIHIYISDTIPHTKGLGTNIKGKPRGMVLNFSFNKWEPQFKKNIEYYIRITAIHEFGHALGFAHEQNRKECSSYNCTHDTYGSIGNWSLAKACDKYSIMNYCNPEYLNKGSLSLGDIDALQFFYGKPIVTGINAAPSSTQRLQIKYEIIFSRVAFDSQTSKFKIAIAKNGEQTNDAVQVTYIFPHGFPSETLSSTDGENSYPITVISEDIMLIKAKLEFYDGTSMVISRLIDP